jgi:hypothetical protein
MPGRWGTAADCADASPTALTDTLNNGLAAVHHRRLLLHAGFDLHSGLNLHQNQHRIAAVLLAAAHTPNTVIDATAWAAIKISFWKQKHN